MKCVSSVGKGEVDPLGVGRGVNGRRKYLV